MEESFIDSRFYAVGDFVPPCVPGVGLADRGPGAVQTGPDGVVTDESASTHCCLVAIGRLQVTSTPNTNDLAGSNSNSGKNIRLVAFFFVFSFFFFFTTLSALRLAISMF